MACPDWPGDTVADGSIAAVATSIVALRSRAIRDDDLKKWHLRLFAGAVPRGDYAGNFRGAPGKPCLNTPVWVVRWPKTPIEGAPADRVHSRMQALNQRLKEFDELHRRWQASEDDLLDLARLLAFCVGEFIRIHPFRNGNGRISRAIWSWALNRFSYALQVRLSPRPVEPYTSVMNSAMEGDDMPLALWILDFLQLAGSPPQTPQLRGLNWTCGLGAAVLGRGDAVVTAPAVLPEAVAATDESVSPARGRRGSWGSWA